jgi:hypothetical protein
MKMARILANLAYSRARLQQGISTARACGDSQWAHDERKDLDSLQRRIDALVKVVRPEVIAEAREITNAPI